MYEFRPRRAPMENTMSHLRFDNNPSTRVTDNAVSRRAGRYSDPINPITGERMPLSARQPASTPSGGAMSEKSPNIIVEGGGDYFQKERGCRPAGTIKNTQQLESVPSDWPKQGLKRVTPVVHPERGHGIKTVNAVHDSNKRHMNIVGSNAIHVKGDEKELTRPLSGIRCRPLPLRADGWMNRQFEEDDRPHTTTSMEVGAGADGHLADGRDDNPEVKRQQHKHAWDHTLTNAERLRINVCDHVMHRAGGVSSFYVALVRGQVGAVQTPRHTSMPMSYSQQRKLTIASLQEQLESLTGFPVEISELAYLLYGAEPGETFPTIVTFRDFTEAFAKVPKAKESASFKI